MFLLYSYSDIFSEIKHLLGKEFRSKNVKLDYWFNVLYYIYYSCSETSSFYENSGVKNVKFISLTFSFSIILSVRKKKKIHKALVVVVDITILLKMILVLDAT